MKNAPNLPVHCEKFLSKTYRLSLEELGALFRLMMVTWNNKGQALPDDPDEMARSLTCTKDRWLKKLRPRLEPLFDLSEGTWKLVGPMNMDEQWAWVQNNIRIKSENGSRGGRPSAQKVAEDLANSTAAPIQQFDETQTAKSLKNIEIAKPVGFEPVKQDESTANVTVTEESKKESPLNPPMGGMVGEDQVQVQPSLPVSPDLPPERTLFAVQEVSTPRRKRSSPEIEAAFVEFKAVFPKRNNPHTWTKAKEHFIAAMRSGVPGELLIETAGMYAQAMKSDGKIGSSLVVDARRWLNERRWENYEGFVPAAPQMNGNVTPLRNGTTNQPPQAVIRRGGLSF